MALEATHKNIPFHVGDTIQVHYRILEKETKAGKTKKSKTEEIKERIQPYEGILISINGVNENRSITVRRMGAGNVGIERVFPLMSPWIDKIVVKKKGSVRRAKLYYIRDKSQVEIAHNLSKR